MKPRSMDQIDIFTGNPAPTDETQTIDFILDQARNQSSPARLCRDCFFFSQDTSWKGSDQCNRIKEEPQDAAPLGSCFAWKPVTDSERDQQLNRSV